MLQIQSDFSGKIMNIYFAVILSLVPCILKMPLLRLVGMKIGKKVKIGFGTLLICSKIVIEDEGYIGHFCVLRAKSLHLGKRAKIHNIVRITAFSVVMRSQSTIFSQNQIAGDCDDKRSTIHLGVASSILQHCYVNLARPVYLGRNVGVGGGSYLFTHGLWLSKLDGFPVAYGEITIEDDVWLPWGCFVMPGITIGTRSIIGACSVVTKNVPPGVLVAGVPAKVVRDKSNIDLNRNERAKILKDISESLGTKLSAVVRIECSQEREFHYINDKLVIVLHKNSSAVLTDNSVLNIVFDELDNDLASRIPAWSLKDYTSSPYKLFSPSILDWINQAATVGARFYPIDED
jgi:acetyltransferase-like isoleucine patch superfamily enzyme